MAEGLESRLVTALASEFPGAEVSVDLLPASRKLTGSVVWEGFADLDQLRRQQRIRGALESRLSREDRASVTFLLPLTPAERRVMRAG
jgi:hypothetical protein